MAKHTATSVKDGQATTETAVSLDAAFINFTKQVGVGSRGLVLMVASGTLVMMVGSHLNKAHTKIDVLAERLEKLMETATGGTKGKSTMRSYIATSKMLYRKIIGEKGDNYGGVVADIAKAKTADDAFEVLCSYLDTNKCGMSYDALMAFVGRKTSNAKKAEAKKKLAEKVVAAGGSVALKAQQSTLGLTAALKELEPADAKKQAVAVAKQVANAYSDPFALALEAFRKAAMIDSKRATSLVSAMLKIIEAVKAEATKAAKPARHRHSTRDNGQQAAPLNS